MFLGTDFHGAVCPCNSITAYGRELPISNPGIDHSATAASEKYFRPLGKSVDESCWCPDARKPLLEINRYAPITTAVRYSKAYSLLLIAINTSNCLGRGNILMRVYR